MGEEKKEKKMGEDELYVLSLANRLRSLDRRQKAIVRSAVQKVFLDIEIGFYNASQQAQPGSYIQMVLLKIQTTKICIGPIKV